MENSKPTSYQLANAIRALTMDAVQKANSGHPGAPMGMADIAQVLWSKHLSHNPNNPNWHNRDRFVLSNGHGSMLLYALLHLSGYDLSINDLKSFRQLHSKTPGHPEYGYAPGVETTTGPLGQGIANAVGMAVAEKALAATFNQPDFPIVDHYTYVFVGDGCLMEGISHEACSLAGTLGLGKLIVIYDDNGISIDGKVQGWFSDDTPQRFTAYGWQVIENIDGHDAAQIDQAIAEAKKQQKPTLICAKTIIGFGSPNKQGTENCHGAPLGEDEIALTKKKLGWDGAPFEVPEQIYAAWDFKKQGQELEDSWQQLWQKYQQQYPELANEFKRRIEKKLPDNWQQTVTDFIASQVAEQPHIASRQASQRAINAYAPILPELIGGSADLAGSNLTLWQQSKGIDSKDATGNYIYYGVREFAMAAMMNGMALYGGFIPYGATFLMFSEYARNALRMAALMKQRAIFVFTHDSIGLGEDGPTHQPVEQIASLRLIPNMHNWRPCDAVESAVAWQLAIERDTGPSCLVFSRQALAHQIRDEQQLANIARGGYVLLDCASAVEAIVIATGSEVEMARKAVLELQELGNNVRLVSMPCTDIFDQQDKSYRQQVLPPEVLARVSVEAGVTDFWKKYTGLLGRNIGIDSFGESAPAEDLFAHFDISAAAIVSAVTEMLAKSS